MIGVTGFQTTTIRQLLDPLNAPNVKQFFVYDVDGDPTNIYFAQGRAVSGEECLEQVFEYQTTSGIKSVQKIAWRSNQWNPLWDIV